jgi:hypothetical protein
VLHRTSRLVQLAQEGRLESHQGRLEEVADEARATLAAMRELLHEMNAVPDDEPSPVATRTAADIEALCRTAGLAGRKVTVRGIPETAAGLPEEVILTTYRLLETALGAGDRDPVRIRLRRGRERGLRVGRKPRLRGRGGAALHLTITGVRLAVNGPATERLRAQATAAEARISFEQAGTVRVLLPLPAGPSQAPACAQEVSPSPHA